MSKNIVIGANFDESENTIVNRIVNSQKISSMARITSDYYNSLGWFVNFESVDTLPNFLIPSKLVLMVRNFIYRK